MAEVKRRKEMPLEMKQGVEVVLEVQQPDPTGSER